MDRALYVAMTGAAQTLKAQAVNSHNLANASTVGFKAELAAQQAVAVDGPLMPTRVNTQLQGQGFDGSLGSIMQTGNPLDVALAPDRWLAVQAPDGSEAYTRAGDLQVGADGLLRNGGGHMVMGDGGPLSVPPNSQIAIGNDGTVTVVPLGQGPEAPVTVGRLKVVDATADQLERGSDGLMRARAGQTPEDASGAVMTSGAVESSNVNLAESMVTMIALARQFEMQVKLMRTAEQNDQASASLMRMG
ncbi:flagellar basal-body rod protein FlgF [Panacagrimonas perspica]|uniref:Flagellar basal-body rod protein FlgF n=1 Tax=Panacagrimonas perspica TaxID=381431 RepID=A0A4S3KAL6_9GAMM|nr:flagellar basal body rod protein FlgF [Panacagrimonas perspica]TDU32460.1 flagellar basal-body rod protein FlgF [Panacagrimonas perspica]THD05377.1 flagellar biosynthesis protein FlgF [Panacagrimonas perspica]